MIAIAAVLVLIVIAFGLGCLWGSGHGWVEGYEARDAESKPADTLGGCWIFLPDRTWWPTPHDRPALRPPGSEGEAP